MAPPSVQARQPKTGSSNLQNPGVRGSALRDPPFSTGDNSQNPRDWVDHYRSSQTTTASSMKPTASEFTRNCGEPNIPPTELRCFSFAEMASPTNQKAWWAGQENNHQTWWTNKNEQGVQAKRSEREYRGLGRGYHRTTPSWMTRQADDGIHRDPGRNHYGYGKELARGSADWSTTAAPARRPRDARPTGLDSEPWTPTNHVQASKKLHVVEISNDLSKKRNLWVPSGNPRAKKSRMELQRVTHLVKTKSRDLHDSSLLVPQHREDLFL